MRMAGAGKSASDDHLTISIQRRIGKLSLPSDCCIFTVPEKLRKSKREAYKPRVIAIRPYHRHTASLNPMQHHKLLYLKNFLHHNPMRCLNDYIKRVKSLEDEARKCYDKNIKLSPDQFAEMMLLDSIFVIQLFLMYSKYQSRLHRDRIFNKPWMLNDVRRDMALLENQMLFFVIQKLFQMAFGTHQKHTPGLLELAFEFFKPVMRMEKLPEWAMGSEVKHFVDMIRLSFLPSVMKVPNEINEEMKFTPTATELVAAGVTLKKGDSKCLFDIEFENGVLKIPYLALDDSTESNFRNIIAFEQCYHLNDRYLIDYMAFMDHLVDTLGDAELLIKEGIIGNWLSNKEAIVHLINSFCEEANLSAESYFFYSLSDKLVNYYEKPYNNWKVTFKRDNCSSPWAVISVIAAVVLLLLTLAQTVCSVLSLI